MHIQRQTSVMLDRASPKTEKREPLGKSRYAGAFSEHALEFYAYEEYRAATRQPDVVLSYVKSGARYALGILKEYGDIHHFFQYSFLHFF